MLPARASWLVAALLTLACAQACADPPVSTDAEATEKAEPAAKTEPPKPVDPNALTPEDQALIDSDPATLTPEQRRKRAYALRKKIMQNPDSEAAKALEEARRAAEAGEINFEAKQPEKPADNGVVIPAPEFLKNQDQSVGKPDQ